MNTKKSYHFFKQITTDENESFKVSCVFNDKINCLDLIFLKDGNAWKSHGTKANLQTVAEQHQLSLDEYYGKLINSFANPTENNISFNISIGKNSFTIHKILSAGIKIKYFCTKLQKANYVECVENLLDELYTKHLQVSNTLINEQKEKHELIEHKNQLETKLNEFVERSNTERNEWFSNFVLVLNEKKREIQHLSELLEAFKAGRSPTNPPVEVKRRRQTINNNSETIKSELNDDDDDDTDDTDKTLPYTHQHTVQVDVPAASADIQQSSSSKINFDFLHDSDDDSTMPSTSSASCSKDLPSKRLNTESYCVLPPRSVKVSTGKSCIRELKEQDEASTSNNDTSNKKEQEQTVLITRKSQQVETTTLTYRNSNNNSPPAIELNTQDLLDRL